MFDDLWTTFVRSKRRVQNRNSVVPGEVLAHRKMLSGTSLDEADQASDELDSSPIDGSVEVFPDGSISGSFQITDPDDIFNGSIGGSLNLNPDGSIDGSIDTSIGTSIDMGVITIDLLIDGSINIDPDGLIDGSLGGSVTVSGELGSIGGSFDVLPDGSIQGSIQGSIFVP